jgi:type IV fimbrial biogenesis protein FimT
MQRRSSSSFRRVHGFSLVELLTVLACVGVMVSVAAPSFDTMAGSMRVSTASNDILGDILLARSEAMKRNRRVVLCKSADGSSCTPDGGWHQGWIVFVDDDGNGLRGGTEEILQRQPALDAKLRLTGNSTVAKYVSYAAGGHSKLVGGGFQAGTLTLCRASLEPGTGRQIILNATGRPRVQKVVVDVCA